MRFDRFTIRGQEAVQGAIGVAEKNQNQQVEPEHLLAAMLDQKEGVVKPILGKIGANAQAVSTEIDAAIAKFPQVSGGQQYFSSRTNTIFQAAQKEAEKMQDEYMSTEHLLITIAAEKEGDAGRILRSNGIATEDVEINGQMIREGEGVAVVFQPLIPAFAGMSGFCGHLPPP